MYDIDNYDNIRDIDKMDSDDAVMRGCLFTIGYIIAMILLVCICACFNSCASHKSLEKESSENDSLKVKVRIETIYVPDTVYVEIPHQKAERTTADSTSTLENDYAISNARINQDGTLYHDLETKPQSKPVGFQKPIEKRDSTVYRKITKTNTYTIVKKVEKELSWWQQTCIYGFYTLFLVLLVMLRKPIWKVIKIVLKIP